MGSAAHHEHRASFASSNPTLTGDDYNASTLGLNERGKQGFYSYNYNDSDLNASHTNLPKESYTIPQDHPARRPLSLAPSSPLSSLQVPSLPYTLLSSSPTKTRPAQATTPPLAPTTTTPHLRHLATTRTSPFRPGAPVAPSPWRMVPPSPTTTPSVASGTTTLPTPSPAVLVLSRGRPP